MKDFLLFRRMLTPVLVQIFFWVLTASSIASAIVSFIHKEFLIGLAALIIGPILMRVVCEVMIVMFRIHDDLIEIRNNTKPKA